MAKSPISNSKPHLFFCCFGFSGKLRRFKRLKTSAAAAGGKRKRPFSWIRFQAKSPPPVRSTFPAERERSKPDSDRLTAETIAPTTAYNSSNEDLAAAVPEEVKDDMVAEKIILESCDHLDLPKKPMGQSQSRFSLTRKLESFRSCRFIQPGSPTTKNDPKSPNPTRAISHSLSFPPSNPTRISQVKAPLTDIQVELKGGNQTSKKYRSTTGLSILIITLAIMVLWGRLCAILCTAAWIFIVASLRSIVEEECDEIDFIESDSYSEGFKKKLVVLKGFIYRNQRENLSKKSIENGH